MSTPHTSKQNVIKVVFNRTWTDIEPKIAAGLVTGAIASAIIAEAAHIGYPLDPGFAALLTAALSFAGGYVKHSTTRETFDGNPEN